MMDPQKEGGIKILDIIHVKIRGTLSPITKESRKNKSLNPTLTLNPNSYPNPNYYNPNPNPNYKWTHCAYNIPSSGYSDLPSQSWISFYIYLPALRVPLVVA